MRAELKPCPFCGDKRVAIHYEHDPDGFGKFSMVRCHACGAQSQGVFASTGNDCPLHYEEVRDAWNRRTTPAPGAPGQEAAAVQAVGAWQPSTWQEQEARYEQEMSEVYALEKALAMFPIQLDAQAFTIAGHGRVTADGDDTFYSKKKVLAVLEELRGYLLAALPAGVLKGDEAP